LCLSDTFNIFKYLIVSSIPYIIDLKDSDY